MSSSPLATQARFHRNEAVWGLLLKNGLAAGHKRQTIKHVDTWYATQSLDLLPKIWHDKVESIFNELMPASLLQSLESALQQYVQGDDAELRPYIKGRVTIEFGTRIDSYNRGSPGWRSRKFSDPLYLTPAGFLQAYPEVDEDLFLDMEQAQIALDFYRGVPNSLGLEKASYQISSPAVLGKIGGAGYKRWVKEVKNQEYTEPRRTLQESFGIYEQSGQAGLKEMYSPAYVYALLRKFKAAGLKVSLT